MSSTALALQKQGQKLYSQGDFEGAIDVFSQALDRPSADTIGILDNRSAAYGRLRNFKQATRDARRMIKDSKEDERGYMRCAKILLQEGKSDMALQIYEYGLDNLPSNHPNRSKLEGLRDKLQSNMEQLKERIILHHRDPFTTLPMEVVFFILQEFSFKQIIAIMRVSKSWNRLLASIRNLWMKIDTTGARSLVRWNSISSYIGRSRAQLTHATIRNLATESTPRVLEFLSRCRRLDHLDLHVWVGGADVYGMLQRSQQQLKSLAVSGDMVFAYHFIPRLLVLLPGLEKLEVWNVKRNMGGRPEENFEWPALLPNLKSITLGSTSAPAEPYDDTTHAVHIPNLHCDIHRLPYPNLQELRLDWDPPYYRPFCFPSIHPYPQPTDVWRLPPLRRLELRGASLRPDFWQVLPTSIEYLHVRGSRSFTNWNDNPEVEFPHLHTLILDDCSWCRLQFLTTFLFTAKAPIQTLRISACSGLLAREISSILSCSNQMDCPAVESMSELALTQCHDMDDEVTSSIVTMLPALKVLDLSATSITGVTIRLLADQRKSESTEMARLDCLVVRGCGGVSRDAVAYGREKGLRVVF